VLGEHTVHRQMANILRKLSLSSRAAAAAWGARTVWQAYVSGGGRDGGTCCQWGVACLFAAAVRATLQVVMMRVAVAGR
jgi:hypothetical protein